MESCSSYVYSLYKVIDILVISLPETKSLRDGKKLLMPQYLFCLNFK
jgi:hypothetical protein